MLIRKGFVTNSSSTSFIAWGLVIPDKVIFGELDNDSKWELIDKLYEIPKVGFHDVDYSNNSILYIDSSRVDTDDFYGIISESDHPPIQADWEKTLTTVCEQFNIKLPEGLQPCWFFTHYAS